MNWFSGKLVITLKDGSLVIVHDVTFAKAYNYLEIYKNTVASTMYYPYPTSLGEVQ